MSATDRDHPNCAESDVSRRHFTGVLAGMSLSMTTLLAACVRAARTEGPITAATVYYLNGHEIVKTPNIVQGIENLVLPPRNVVLPVRSSIFRKKEVIGNW